MRVTRPDDPTSFLADAEHFLLADEARNNLILGIAGTLRDRADAYSTYGLWLVEQGDRVVGAALRTPPHNLLLAADDASAEALAEELAEEGADLPGVTGNVPEVDRFVERWRECTGVAASPRMRQGVYALERVLEPSDVAGSVREALESDRDLLVAWVEAFVAEALHESSPGGDAERVVGLRLAGERGGFMLWEDGEPVSLAGWGGPTPNGIRIGPVYTPPEHRGRGYGSAVTAAASARNLAAGRRFCFLYTDLANPTSNKIYTAIGYEAVCESVEYGFVRP